MCLPLSLLSIKGLKASWYTECPDSMCSSPRISCAPNDVQPGKRAEEENPCLDAHNSTWLELCRGLGAWHPSPCNVTELSKAPLAVAWAVLGSTGEPLVGARLRGNLKLCPRDCFELTRVQ